MIMVSGEQMAGSHSKVDGGTTMRFMVEAGEVEIRQVFEAEDFGPALTKELRQAEERLRAQAVPKRQS